MKCLVTGGAGFIGRWVVKKLLEDGKEVVVLDDFSRGKKKNLSEFKDNPNLLDVIEGSIYDKEVVTKAFSTNPDICIHMASTCDVQHSIERPEDCFNVDVIGGFNVLEECRKNNVKFVFISTCMVYGQNDGKAIDEDVKTFPVSPYAAAKLSTENLALSYFQTYNLPVTILRPFNTYGPFGLFEKNKGEGGVIVIFLKRFIDGEKLNIFGSGEQMRDFLYVEDCASFIVEASFNEKAIGQIINAGTGREISVKELAKMIAKDDDKVAFVDHHHPQSDVHRLVCNNDKVKNLLGWSPRFSLEEGLERTIAWLKKEKE